MIILYWCARTRASRALWLLEELGKPFEVRQVDISDPESKNNPEFRQASPMGKVPAIRDGEVCLADSAAIGLYLADRYPEAGLAPAVDATERGKYLYWMVFTPGVIEPSMAERVAGWEANPRQHGWGSFDLMIETLEKGLGDGPWLLGDTFSAADVIVGSSVNFMKMFGILPDNEVLSSYVERCLDRPAYQRALAREQSG